MSIVQTVHESRVYNNAKIKLKTGHVTISQIPDDSTPEYTQVIKHWWSVRDKLTFLRQNLARASGRDYAKSISITLDKLYAIGESQNWQCAYTGVPLEFTRGGDFGFNTNPYSCTIDRINSNAGYRDGNIQLITWQANCAKNAMTHEQFIDLCKLVANRH